MLRTTFSQLEISSDFGQQPRRVCARVSHAAVCPRAQGAHVIEFADAGNCFRLSRIMVRPCRGRNPRLDDDYRRRDRSVLAGPRQQLRSRRQPGRRTVDTGSAPSRSDKDASPRCRGSQGHRRTALKGGRDWRWKIDRPLSALWCQPGQQMTYALLKMLGKGWPQRRYLSGENMRRLSTRGEVIATLQQPLTSPLGPATLDNKKGEMLHFARDHASGII